MGSEPQYRCPACGDRHGLSDREREGGQRVCPECGEHTAFLEDEGRQPPGEGAP